MGISESLTHVNKGNARLRIFKGLSNKKLGITPDMEVGHLYQCENNIEKLSELGIRIGLSPSWIQNRLTGLAHFDLWGTPLKNAKKMFKVVTLEEAEQDLARISGAVKQELESIKKGVMAEYRNDDLVIKNVGYVTFISKSKGRGRLRKCWTEVELYRYCGAGWHTEKMSEFDGIASEITSGRIEGDALMWWVKEHCDHRGGKNKGIH